MTRYPDYALGIAEIRASRGESDAAFLSLERAFNQKDVSLWHIKIEPLLNSLKGDPRYKAFLKKMNLPERRDTMHWVWRTHTRWSSRLRSRNIGVLSSLPMAVQAYWSATVATRPRWATQWKPLVQAAGPSPWTL